MKKILVLIVSLVFTTLSTVSWSTEDLEIINGDHWVASSLEQQRAFLFGVGNMLEIEQAMAGKDYETIRKSSIVPILLEGLSGISIADLVTQINNYYEAHPKQMGKSVIEVLYLDMALPNLNN